MINTLRMKWYVTSSIVVLEYATWIANKQYFVVNSVDMLSIPTDRVPAVAIIGWLVACNWAAGDGGGAAAQ